MKQSSAEKKEKPIREALIPFMLRMSVPVVDIAAEMGVSRKQIYQDMGDLGIQSGYLLPCGEFIRREAN